MVRSLGNLIDVLKAQGKYKEAKPLVAELLNNRRANAEKTDANASDMNAYAWDLLTVKPTIKTLAYWIRWH